MDSDTELDEKHKKSSKVKKHSKSHKDKVKSTNKDADAAYDDLLMLTDEKKVNTLWDLALEQNKESAKTDQYEKGILFLGDKSSGKTTILLRILDRDELSKPTIAIEYNFGKKSKGNNLDKEVGHFWELGGGKWLHQLIDTVIDLNFLRSGSAVALFLDLSRPGQLWPTLKHWLDALTARITSVINDLPVLEAEKIKVESWKRVGEEHSDREVMQPLLVPLAIIGTKYDIFQSFDLDKIKLICKTLRFVAHRYGAHLQFCSSLKHESLLNKTKILINHLVYGTQLTGSNSQTDHSKPLSIAAGQDSFADIGTPNLQDMDISRSGLRNPMDLWANAYCAVFPPEDLADSRQLEDPVSDSQYKEKIVDDMRRIKDEELLKYQQKCEKKRKELYSRSILDAVA